MSRSPSVIHSVEVTDGRRRLGEIEQLDTGEYRARDAVGAVVGLHDRRADASHAVWLADRADRGAAA